MGKISTRIILKYLPSDPIILDAGAHIGIDSQRFAKQFTKGQVFALEPVAALFQKLSKRLSQYSNCKLFQLGLGDFKGSSQIYLSSGTSDASSSLLIPKDHLISHPKVKFDGVEEILVTTLDDFMLSQNIKVIDLLWLDLQGMEPAVLRKSYRALRKVRLIHTEVNFIETYQGAELFSGFNIFLNSHNFKLLRLNTDFKDQGNALYLNKSFN